MNARRLTENDRQFFIRLVGRTGIGIDATTVVGAIEKLVINLIERNVLDTAREEPRIGEDEE